jgi:hypothetical protein
VLPTIAALALLAAACGDDGAVAASGGEQTLAITAPADGATVGTEFTVTLAPSDEIGEPDTGLHHVHLYYDGNRSEDPADYDIAYSTSFTVTRLDPGEHTIEAVLANADHSVTDVMTEIAVTVAEDGAADPGGAGDEPATTSTTDGIGYGY